MLNVQLILFIYSLVFINIIIFYSWKKFFDYTNALNVKTNSILTLFPVELLLENSYVMSWVKKFSVIEK